MQERVLTSVHSVKLEPANRILAGTRTTYQATGDASCRRLVGLKVSFVSVAFYLPTHPDGLFRVNNTQHTLCSLKSKNGCWCTPYHGTIIHPTMDGDIRFVWASISRPSFPYGYVRVVPAVAPAQVPRTNEQVIAARADGEQLDSPATLGASSNFERRGHEKRLGMSTTICIGDSDHSTGHKRYRWVIYNVVTQVAGDE